jgi:hypothetical protein
MTDQSDYRHARNRYNKLVKDTIRSHFQNKLHNNQGDLKKTWKTINELIADEPQLGSTLFLTFLLFRVQSPRQSYV